MATIYLMGLRGREGSVELKGITDEEPPYFFCLFTNSVQTVLNLFSIGKVITYNDYTLIILKAKYALSSRHCQVAWRLHLLTFENCIQLLSNSLQK